MLPFLPNLSALADFDSQPAECMAVTWQLKLPQLPAALFKDWLDDCVHGNGLETEQTNFALS